MKALEDAIAARDHTEILRLTEAVGSPYIGDKANTSLHMLVDGPAAIPLSAFDPGAWPNAPLVLQVADILDRAHPGTFQVHASRPNTEGVSARQMAVQKRDEAAAAGRSTLHLDHIIKRMQ